MPQPKKGKGRARRRVKKNVPYGIAHVKTSFNNTIVTITDPEGNVVCWESAGSAGFKGSRKSTPFAAQVTADAAARKGMEHGVERVEVHAKGAGSGRDTAIRSLQAAGLQVTTVKDVSPQAHNGCRPKKRRRRLAMARDTGPQCKQCRREGQKLFLKGERCLTEKCGVERRSYPPGEHGRGRVRASEYRNQLREKQKARRFYGVLEKPVPRLLRQGLAPGRRHRRQPAAPARATPRQRPRPPRLRRLAAPGAPAGQPRPLAGQRPPRRHPQLSGPSRRRDHDPARVAAPRTSSARRPS